MGKMQKCFLVLLMFLVGCTTHKSDFQFEIVNSQTISKLFKETCETCAEIKEAYLNPGDQRGFQKFDNQDKTYILVTSGKKTGGYSIEIKDIKEDLNYITIEARDKPPSSPITTAVIVNPTLIISMNLTHKTVVLSWN